MLHCIQESRWLQCTQGCCLTLNSTRKIPPAPLGLQLHLFKVACTEQRCFGELPCLDRVGRQWEVRTVEQEVIPPPNRVWFESLASTNTNKQSVCLYPTFLLESRGYFWHILSLVEMSVKARNSEELLGEPRGNCPRHRMMR